MRHIGTDGKKYDTGFWYVGKDGESKTNVYTLGLRPVITLVSDIQTNDGDGSIDNAFKLVAKKN